MFHFTKLISFPLFRVVKRCVSKSFEQLVRIFTVWLVILVFWSARVTKHLYSFTFYFSDFSLTEGQKDPAMKRKRKSKHVGNKPVPENMVVIGKRSLLPWKKLMMRRRNSFR